jgi:hypothetical protein
MTSGDCFLAFVLTHYLGTPQSGRYWKCPICQRRNPSVVVNEPKAGCKTKWRCVHVSCPLQGRCQDEFDLVWHFHRYTRFPDRKVIVDGLRQEWREAKWRAKVGTEPTDQLDTEPHNTDPDHSTETSTGHGRSPTTNATPPISFTPWGHKRAEEERHRDVALAWGDIVQDINREGHDPKEVYAHLRTLHQQGHFADQAEFVAEVLDYWARFFEWSEKIDAAHMACCTDPDCDWVCCRAARGLPPLRLTDAEKREVAQRRIRQRAEEAAELERMVQQLAQQREEQRAEEAERDRQLDEMLRHNSRSNRSNTTSRVLTGRGR